MINDKMAIKDEVTFQMGKGRTDSLIMSGFFKLKLFNKFGNLKDQRAGHNLVTTLGKNMAADQLLAAPAIAKPGWMEVGTGSGQTDASTILAAYVIGSRTALSSKTRSGAVVTMVCTMGAGVGTGAIIEAGIFNVVTQNTTDLICYAGFAVVNKAAADSLEITWTLTSA